MSSQSVHGKNCSMESLIELMDKQTAILEQLVRPYMMVDVSYWSYNRNKSTLRFRLRNVGRTPAYDIQTTINPPISAKLDGGLDIFEQTIGIICPGEQVICWFSSIEELFKTRSELQFVIEVQYADSNGSSHRVEIPVSARTLSGLSFDSTPSDRIVGKLKGIESKLESIQKGVEKIVRWVDAH